MNGQDDAVDPIMVGKVGSRWLGSQSGTWVCSVLRLRAVIYFTHNITGIDGVDMMTSMKKTLASIVADAGALVMGRKVYFFPFILALGAELLHTKNEVPLKNLTRVLDY